MRYFCGNGTVLILIALVVCAFIHRPVGQPFTAKVCPGSASIPVDDALRGVSSSTDF